MQTSTQPLDIDVATLGPSGDALFAELNRLREYDPLYWSATSHCWIVTGHAEVMEGFSGTLPLSSSSIPSRLRPGMPLDEMAARWPNTVLYMPHIVTNKDGADHARLRKLFVKAFSRKVVEDLRPFVRERVNQLLDKAASGEPVEFNEHIARMLPGSVILNLLGMSQDYLSRLEFWDDGVSKGMMSFNPPLEVLDQLEVVVSDMMRVFTAEIEDRRRHPRGDLISLMLNATEDGDRMTMEEMLGGLVLVVVAGHDSTANSITLGVRAMAKHPEAWAYWRAHPDKSVDSAIELMRYVAMSASQARLVAEDFEWHGRKLHRGDIVMLLIAGANRDPRVYREPETLDLTRRNDSVMIFGPGLHHCIGHLLAKLEVSEFFNALVARFDGADVLEEPVFTTALAFRGVDALHMRFHPRRLS
jgi:pimeloyl-[acyl-carrier protein] synthase